MKALYTIKLFYFSRMIKETPCICTKVSVEYYEIHGMAVNQAYQWLYAL
jgi:hypothetical protein